MLKKDQKESEPDEKEERNIRDQNIQIQSVTYEGKDKRILLQGRQQETDRDKKIRFHFPYWWTTVTQIKTVNEDSEGREENEIRRRRNWNQEWKDRKSL